MLTMELDIRDCKWKNGDTDYIYCMTPAFTKFYLGYKHNLHGIYPPYIDVRGNDVLRFDRQGMTGSYDVYTNGKFRLLIKYRK